MLLFMCFFLAYQFTPFTIFSSFLIVSILNAEEMTLIFYMEYQNKHPLKILKISIQHFSTHIIIFIEVHVRKLRKWILLDAKIGQFSSINRTIFIITFYYFPVQGYFVRATAQF